MLTAFDSGEVLVGITRLFGGERRRTSRRRRTSAARTTGGTGTIAATDIAGESSTTIPD